MQELHGDGETVQGLRVLGRGATHRPRRAVQGHLHHGRPVHPRDGAWVIIGQVQDAGREARPCLLHAVQRDLDGEVPVQTSHVRLDPSPTVRRRLREGGVGEVPVLEPDSWG